MVKEVKFPYGGFDSLEFERDARDTDPLKAWIKLQTIQEYLEDGEPVPPNLAAWLGEAIKYAVILAKSGDETAVNYLTRRLGITRGVGDSDSEDKRWLVYGGMMDRFRQANTKDAAALAATHAEMKKEGQKAVSDTMLKKWRKRYSDASET